MDHQPTVQALDPDHTPTQPPRKKVEEWNGVATSLPFNVQPPAQATETETVDSQAPPPPSSVMVEPPRSPLGTASVAPSTKRNSPDEGSMDEREVKRVRAEVSFNQCQVQGGWLHPRNQTVALSRIQQTLLFTFFQY